MNVLFQRGRLPILHVLSSGRPRRSINELARNAGLSVATCWRAVQDLRKLGLVLVETHGRVSLVSVNAKAPSVRAILGASFPDPHRMAYDDFERRLLRRLPRLRVRLFGSVARGDATPDSDVDALVEYAGSGYSKAKVEQACVATVMEVTDEFMIPVVPLIVPRAEGIE